MSLVTVPACARAADGATQARPVSKARAIGGLERSVIVLRPPWLALYYYPSNPNLRRRDDGRKQKHEIWRWRQSSANLSPRRVPCFTGKYRKFWLFGPCLLYTSDAADDLTRV